jgi:hypothetical protein
MPGSEIKSSSCQGTARRSQCKSVWRCGADYARGRSNRDRSISAKRYLRRFCQIAHGGHSGHKPLIKGNGCTNLCLLQHDFGHPNPIRRAIVLPGQMRPSVLVEPVE